MTAPRPDPLRVAADQALIAVSQWFIATAPTAEHAARHVELARERGATDAQIEHALSLQARHLAGSVTTIEGDPLP